MVKFFRLTKSQRKTIELETQVLALQQTIRELQRREIQLGKENMALLIKVNEYERKENSKK